MLKGAETEEAMSLALHVTAQRRQAVQGLAKAGRNAVGEFLSAEKAVEKLKEQAGAAVRKRGRPSKAVVGVAEHAPMHVAAFPPSTDGEANRPFLLSNSDMGQTLRKSTHAIAIESSDRFAPAFARSSLRTTVGRACRALYDEASRDRCFDMVSQLLPGKILPTLAPSTAQVLRDACVPNHTGLTKDSICCAPDSEHLASLRVTLSGTRFVVVVLYADLVKFATAAPAGGQPRVASVAHVTPEWLKQFFMDISVEDSEELKKVSKNVFLGHRRLRRRLV